MEAPMYHRSASQKPNNYLLSGNQINPFDDKILQLIFWTMNSCETRDLTSNACPPVNPTQAEYAQNLPPNLFGKDRRVTDDSSEPVQQLPENHRKVNHRCLHSLGPPPRPFKKARYAWEIKNYDFTLKKMCQSATESSGTSANQQNHDKSDKEAAESVTPQVYSEGPNFCMGAGQLCASKMSQMEGKTPQMHMIGPPPHQGGFVGPLMPTSYHAHYGAVMGGPNPAHPHHATAPLTHSDRLSSFHAQIPPDPDARLIRWHTRQLCRSIFDNTVNRMLENMGFSPVTERSQALHPLLVLSLSDDEEREAEEAHQRSLETQALSAALHQKGLLPAPYHYDALESATTSDYDSSEEESELGDAAPEDLPPGDLPPGDLPAGEQPPPAPQPPSAEGGIDEEEAFLSFNPALANLIEKPPNPHAPHHPILSGAHPRPAQNHCDYRNHCDPCDDNPSNPTDRNDGERGTQGEGGPTTPPTSPRSVSPPKECLSRCQGAESPLQHLDKRPKMDNNDNCLQEADTCLQGTEECLQEADTCLQGTEECLQEADTCLQGTDECLQKTVIEGTVQKRSLEDCHDREVAAKVARESDNNNDAYFVRNSIHMTLKQPGLGYQTA